MTFFHFPKFFCIFALMKHVLYTFFLLTALLFVTVSCSDSLTHEDDEQLTRTVLIYAAAENSLSSFAAADRQELITAVGQGSIPQDCRIVLYEDGIDMPRITIFSRSEYKVVENYAMEQNSADRSVMLATLQKMIAMAPARSYGLVLWSHGSGWDSKDDLAKSAKGMRPRAFGVDNGRNVESDDGVKYGMNVTDVEWVLAQLPHFDYILWDACLMQGIETAYQIRKYATWIMGSPIETPAYGAPYSYIANSLCTSNIENIMEQYRRYYTPNSPYQVPFSAIRAGELDNLAAATAPYIGKYLKRSAWPDTDLPGAQMYVPEFLEKPDGSMYLTGMPRALDICSVMAQMLTGEEYGRWEEQYRRAVPYANASDSWYSSYAKMTINHDTYHSVGTCDRRTDKEHYGAVSIFIPDELFYKYYNIQGFFRKFSWYRDAGFEAAGW